MDLTIVFGYIGALFVGITLGLIGSGGSILSLPIFVYLFGLNPVLASAYSLFTVGLTSLIGSIKNIKLKLIDVNTVLYFSFSAAISVYITRKYLIDLIPDEIISLGWLTITKEKFLMLFFAVLIYFAGIAMIKKRKDTSQNQRRKSKYDKALILLEGSVVGFITGLVGAGGGFIIIPVLVLFSKLNMKNAIATSLVIISIKSLIGFIGDIENLDIDWLFLIKFSLISIIGIFIGQAIGLKIDGSKLKKGFGYFIIIIASLVIVKEIFYPDLSLKTP
ncbi:sulfite exporter TauE/SafE family protein [Flavobacteriaceae bacterium]|nr:sulfite exporter TauE/SafE family protein [Flavobacteriaceae bacterium]